MTSQLEKMGQPYVFVEAVDKNMLSDRHYTLYNDTAVKKQAGQSLSRGEIACALSHAEIWKLALERGVDYAVILEDDAELGPAFSTTIEHLQAFPEGWDIVNFCSNAPQEPTGTELPNRLKVGRIIKGMSGTKSYCVTRKGLQTMLEHVYPLKASADDLLSSLARMKQLNCYGTLPQIVKPSTKFTSSIWQDQTMTEKHYCIHPEYVQRREPVQNFMDNIEASAIYQRGVYQKAREHYRSGKVLDIGCGVGDKMAEFFPAEVTLGLDLPPALDVAKTRHPDREWRQSDFNQIPEGKYTVVVSADVIEHILDPDDMLDFIEKIDFDLFVMSTPDRDTLPRGKEGPPHNPTHYREWNQKEFREYIGARFDVVDQYQCKEPGYFSQVVEFTKKS